MNSRSQKDLDLWGNYNKTKSDEDLTKLMNQMKPVIMSEARKWHGTLAPQVLEHEAKKLAKGAFDSYQPGKAALNTHVTNRLQKISRISYTHQNPARLPEHRQIKFHTFNTAKTNLEEQLGRSPSIAELADDLAWSQREVERFNSEIRSTYTESAPVPPTFITDTNEDQGIMDFFYYDLPDQDKVIFEHTTGYGGAKKLSNTAIQKKTGLSTGQLMYKKKNIQNQAQQVLGGAY